LITTAKAWSLATAITWSVPRPHHNAIPYHRHNVIGSLPPPRHIHLLPLLQRGLQYKRKRSS
ncbi:MAG: hypothetical protein AAFU33_20705, partial [Bacteroidota bacterium]